MKVTLDISAGIYHFDLKETARCLYKIRQSIHETCVDIITN